MTSLMINDAVARKGAPLSSRSMRRGSKRLLPFFGLVVIAFSVLTVVASPASAQEENAPELTKKDPLALKEEMIRDRFQRFEDRVFRLRESLSDREPDNAARLRRVIERAGELGLADRLDKLAEVFNDPARLNQALAEQGEWLADADRLLAILVERDSDNEERKDEMQRLEGYHEKVTEILEEQRSLREDAARGEMTGRMRAQLDQASRRVDELLRRQEALSKETQLGAAGAKSKELSEGEAELSRDTKQLAEDLKRLGELEPDESADSPELEAAREQAKSAGQSAQRGAGKMGQAGEQLKSGNPGGAKSPQEEAEQALREAKERLEEAKRKLGEKSDSEKLANEQTELAEETGDLAEQMKKDASESSEGQQGGQQGGQQSGQQGGEQGESSPGQQSVDQAQQEMQDASKSLSQKSGDDASESQDRAIEELEQAQKELEEALNQLRKEEKAETLRDLESRFRDMLAKQRPINETTVQLADAGADQFKRPEQLKLAELSLQQRTLSQDAAACLHILDEDGTTIAFPRVVGQLVEDMTSVADRLAAMNVGPLTRTIEQEIVDTLEQLLEAVQKMQQENEQQDGQPQQAGGPGEAPLLPGSAELKLLRASQTRINTRTSTIEAARSEGSEKPDSLTKAIASVTARQVECAETAAAMRDSEK